MEENQYDDQIIKSGLSDGRRTKFLPSVVGVVYDLFRYECHLGNVGLDVIWGMSTKRPLALGVQKGGDRGPPLPRSSARGYQPVL